MEKMKPALRRGLRAFAGTTVAAVAIAMPASAAASPATVTAASNCSTPCEFSTYTLRIEAGADDPQSHDITASTDLEGILIEDRAGVQSAVQPGDLGCTQLTPTSVRCGVAPQGNPSFIQITDLEILGGAADDHVRLGTHGSVQGRGGNDSLVGATPTILGGSADLDGGSGDDQLQVEGARRGFLIGGSGRDLLVGGEKKDFLKGESDNDQLFGGPGADDLRGGGGRDLLIAGRGQDGLFGGNGPDLLQARDREADRPIDCGPGRGDRVRLDAKDASPRRC